MSVPSVNISLPARAAISDGDGGFSLERIDVAPPQAGEIRVRMTAAGICHTDHASLCWPGPLVIGHEGAGVVESLGDGVDDLKLGEAVLLNWAIPCGVCLQCVGGNGALCERTHGMDPKRLGTSRAQAGHTRWRGTPIERAFNLGTFSELTVVRREAATPLPRSIPPDLACPLGCGVMTGVGSVINVARVMPGDSVAVLGCGGVGLSVVQGARIAGARRIVAIDPRQASLERAAALGATDILRVAPGDDHDRLIGDVQALTDRRGVDHAFEATGVAALAFLPLRLVRNGGTAVQVSGAHGEVAVPMPWFMWNKHYLTPLYGGCHPSRDFPRLFDWVAQGVLRLDELVTHRYRLEDLGQGLADMLSGTAAKGVVTFP
jgi:S-(hydroxymethyl)glutathione dehydrogenase/alcohol dehydrogenase